MQFTFYYFFVYRNPMLSGRNICTTLAYSEVSMIAMKGCPQGEHYSPDASIRLIGMVASMRGCNNPKCCHGFRKSLVYIEVQKPQSTATARSSFIY